VSDERPIVFAAVFTKSLGLSALLEGSGLNASRVATAQLLVTSRLIEPSSDSCVPGGRRIDSAAGAKPRSPREPVSQWALIYQNLGIHWTNAFPPIKSFANR
jgi:hypothetical protein